MISSSASVSGSDPLLNVCDNLKAARERALLGAYSQKRSSRTPLHLTAAWISDSIELTRYLPLGPCF